MLITPNAFVTLIYGHRGARGLSPENTIPAYHTAIKLGVNAVDMDIHMTKDGVLVVTHDFALNPTITRDRKGQWIKQPILIKDLTLAELQTYDVGQIKPGSNYAKLFPDQKPIPKTQIPTLVQVIEYVKEHAGNKINFQIEIKSDPRHPEWSYAPEVLADALAKLLDKEEIDQTAEIQAFDFRILLALQKITPKIKTAYLTSTEGEKDMRAADPKIAGLWSAGKLLKDYQNSIPDMIKALGGAIWGPQDTEISAEDVKRAHALGLKVIVWSWPEKNGSEFAVHLNEKLLAMGVDGIITDRPDELIKLMAERR